MVKVPPAVGDSPMWPLPGIRKVVYTTGGKAFRASRAGGKRYHVGIDILAPRGASVIAPEDGKIVATQRFNGPNAHAVLFETNSGIVLLFGEVEPGSWNKYGVSIGSTVRKGEPIADVGINPGGSTMLHFEAYTGGTRRNARWMQGSPPPGNILDPTPYLKAAARGEKVEGEESEPHDHSGGDEDHGDEDPDHGQEDSEDKTGTDDDILEGDIIDPDEEPEPERPEPKIPNYPQKPEGLPWQKLAFAAGVIAAMDGLLGSPKRRRRRKK